MKAPPLSFTKDCCTEWGSLIGGFYWFSLMDHPTVLAMPCLLSGANRHRVNHCPSCGKPCRNAVVDEARVLAARGDS